MQIASKSPTKDQLDLAQKKECDFSFKVFHHHSKLPYLNSTYLPRVTFQTGIERVKDICTNEKLLEIGLNPYNNANP